MRLIDALVCLLAAPPVQLSVSAGNIRVYGRTMQAVKQC